MSIFVLPQILIKLAIEEPGPNWIDETYTHSWGEPNVAGWFLPEGWARHGDEQGVEGGPRRSGILSLRYITSEVRTGCDCDVEPERG